MIVSTSWGKEQMALPVAARNSVARQTFPMVRTLAIAISLLMLAVAAPSAADPGIVYFGEAHRVAVLTGPKSINATHTRYGVHGTDLGITWQGAGNRFLMAFGDTFGRAGSDWRSNTLAVSSDRVLADGMRFDGMITDRPRHAKELLPSRKIDNVEKTVVPTGGVHVAGRDYLSYMSVRRWGAPGAWTTNHAGIAMSSDGGRTWRDVPSARRRNTPRFDHPFQVVSTVRRDGFVYLFGTPNGRFGDARLARVPERALTQIGAYEYWTGPTTGWRKGDTRAAVPVLPGPVGEISVQYNQSLRAWMIMYLDERHQTLTMRLGREPTGPWTPQVVIASAGSYPQLYGGFLHPLSRGLDVYFAVSEFGSYNVSLMRLQLPFNLVATALNQLPARTEPLPNPGPAAPVLPMPAVP